MNVVRNESIVFCDVDDTLVMWGDAAHDETTIAVCDPYDMTNVISLRPHKGHIKVLKDRKARGAYITVWSAGGFKWAEAVVLALGLEKYVDKIMSKPIMYIDDKEAKDILGERLYIPYGDDYG